MMPERTSEALSMASWMEKCQPGPLIDMFWHSHMLMPVKYENDCRALLVNEIIDHEPGYSPTKHSDSDVHSKDEDIFKFERIFQNHPYLVPSRKITSLISLVKVSNFPSSLKSLRIY